VELAAFLALEGEAEARVDVAGGGAGERGGSGLERLVLSGELGGRIGAEDGLRGCGAGGVVGGVEFGDGVVALLVAGFVLGQVVSVRFGFGIWIEDWGGRKRRGAIPISWCWAGKGALWRGTRQRSGWVVETWLGAI